MLQIDMGDFLAVLENCAPYLIAFGVVAVLAIFISIYSKKMKESSKFMARGQAIVAVVLAFVITSNLIILGPCYTLVSLAMGQGTITEESSAAAEELCEEIAAEGITLLKNDGILPLKESPNLNVFGWASTNPCYGGTGSGALSDLYPTVTLLEGLQNAGFNLNEELENFYTSYRTDRPVVGLFGQDWTLPEPPVSTYSKEMIENTKKFSDTAVVVISRVGGEMADIPTDVNRASKINDYDKVTVTFSNNSTEYDDFAEGGHYLQLSQSERNMLELVCDNFDDVIVVYNGANSFELGFVDEYEQIKAAIWCAGAGQNGFNSLGEILNGTVNPSGHTSDTFVKDLTKAPYYNNIGIHVYDNMSEFKVTHNRSSNSIPSFVNYVEGIYVGYRFYETAAAEGLIDYDKTVQYPFGYGLSYTTFTQKMGPLSEADGVISFDVTVSNTGSVEGKDAVEVFYNPPYTNGGIEKSVANLIAFEKTDLLAPGESQTIKLSFAVEDMASYDYSNGGSYVLEQGDYTISINEDSHHIFDSEVYTVASTVRYDSSNPRSSDETAATNQFDIANGDLTYLSRANGFANYAEATKAPESYTMPQKYKDQFINNLNYDIESTNNPADVMPTTGADNGIMLIELRGKDKEDPMWDTLLDQLTLDDMKKLIGRGGYQTAEISKIGKVQTVDCDGPASINNNFTGTASIGFPSAVMIASTWSKSIALKFGQSIGKMADEMNVSGWYAPAINGHRSAFNGRNFEYYSEDGVLSGNIAAQAVLGAAEYGVYSYLKHFAFNDQESHCRNMLCTWSNEQALREIYLKPFEIAVKQGGARAVMTSFNYIGVTNTGATPALMTNVLRNEWGFDGFALTDFFAKDGYGLQNSDQLVLAGTNAMLATFDGGTSYVQNTDSATTVKAMRQACKNILFTTVNSRAYDDDNLNPGTPGWKIALFIIDLAIVAGLIAVELLVIRRGYLKRKSISE